VSDELMKKARPVFKCKYHQVPSRIVYAVLLYALLGRSSSARAVDKHVSRKNTTSPPPPPWVISIRRARIHVGDDHNLSDTPTKCVIDYSASARKKAKARSVKGINRNP